VLPVGELVDCRPLAVGPLSSVRLLKEGRDLLTPLGSLWFVDARLWQRASRSVHSSRLLCGSRVADSDTQDEPCPTSRAEEEEEEGEGEEEEGGEERGEGGVSSQRRCSLLR